MRRAIEMSRRGSLEIQHRRRLRRGSRQGRQDRFRGHEPSRGQPRSHLARRDGGHPSGVHHAAELRLPGCTLYTSAEPCPMCMATCYWAGIEQVFYAATVGDAFEYGNFDDRPIYEQLALPKEQRSIKLTQKCFAKRQWSFGRNTRLSRTKFSIEPPPITLSPIT